jgi:hypothetical protein
MVATVPPLSVGDPPAPGGGRRRRWFVVASVAVLVLIALDAVLAIAWPRHHASRPLRFAPPPNETALNSTAHELVTLLQRGAGLTVHATYRAAGNGAVLELWQLPPRLREDVVQTAGGHVVQTSTMTDGTTNRICYRRDTGPLTCQTVGAAQRQAVGLDGILSAIVDGLAGQPVAVASSSVGGTKVRCFTVSAQTKVCAASDGLPVLIAGQNVTYQLVSRSPTVDAAVFAPPKA